METETDSPHRSGKLVHVRDVKTRCWLENLCARLCVCAPASVCLRVCAFVFVRCANTLLAGKFWSHLAPCAPSSHILIRARALHVPYPRYLPFLLCHPCKFQHEYVISRSHMRNLGQAEQRREQRRIQASQSLCSVEDDVASFLSCPRLAAGLAHPGCRRIRVTGSGVPGVDDVCTTSTPYSEWQMLPCRPRVGACREGEADTGILGFKGSCGLIWRGIRRR